MALSRRLRWLLAITCGVTIANVYYAQPLLHTVAAGLHISQSTAGFLVTGTQFGFAGGLVFVVPLGDLLPRRPLFASLLSLDAAVLAASAAAPRLSILVPLAVLIGLSSVVVQMLIPYAATLASDKDRARAISALLGAVLLGILLSRTFAGLVAAGAGWRGVYASAAVLMVAMAVLVGRAVPRGDREVSIGYLAQMRAVGRLALIEPVLRWRSLIGAAQFGAFSCFWTTVTFLLAGPPYGYSQAAIGLFALVGAAGAASVFGGGRILDRYRRLRWPITGVVLIGLLGSFALLALGAYGLVWLILGALLMDACSQSVHVTNQAVIYDLVDAARSRVTTIYMTTYFIGGALGTSAGTLAYDHAQWMGACATAGVFSGIALLGWVGVYRHEHTGDQPARGARAGVAAQHRR